MHRFITRASGTSFYWQRRFTDQRYFLNTYYASSLLKNIEVWRLRKIHAAGRTRTTSLFSVKFWSPFSFFILLLTSVIRLILRCSPRRWRLKFYAARLGSRSLGSSLSRTESFSMPVSQFKSKAELLETIDEADWTLYIEVVEATSDGSGELAPSRRPSSWWTGLPISGARLERFSARFSCDHRNDSVKTVSQGPTPENSFTPSLKK